MLALKETANQTIPTPVLCMQCFKNIPPFQARMLYHVKKSKWVSRQQILTNRDQRHSKNKPKIYSFLLCFSYWLFPSSVNTWMDPGTCPVQKYHKNIIKMACLRKFKILKFQNLLLYWRKCFFYIWMLEIPGLRGHRSFEWLLKRSIYLKARKYI